MKEDKLLDIIRQLDDTIYMMDVAIPSWVHFDDVFSNLRSISDSLKEVANGQG